MAAYMRAHYTPGEFQRAGNTKTHGVVRGEFTVRDDVPAEWRHGVFAEPRTFRAWVRFAGPGPASPPDIEEVGVVSISAKLMGVPGPKLLDDERFTQDFTGISAPTFTTPDVRENAKLQAASLRGTPLFYFINPFDSHLLDGVMQGLWARTLTSPLETPYWGCVPYLLGEGRAMQYSFRPRLRTRSRVPRLPFRPPDHYLREAMAATLARQDVEFDFLVQVQTDAHRMPVENASVRWPERLSRPVPVATLRLPRQTFDTPGAARVRPQPVLQPLALCPRAPPARKPEPRATPPLRRAVAAPAVDERDSAPRADRGRGLRAQRGWSASEAREVAERAKARQEEVRPASDRDELREPGRRGGAARTPAGARRCS